MNTKILFITKKRSDSYGVSYGLLNSARFVAEALQNIYHISCKVVEVIDNNCIDRAVHLYQPTHVIIEALWVVPSKMEILIKLYKQVHWTIRIHSKAPFLANEGIAFDWINQYLKLSEKYKNISISTNNIDFHDDMVKTTLRHWDYLPNIYILKNKLTYPYRGYEDYIHIGCFGAIRPLKNHLEQAIAAIIFANSIGKKLYFHINSGRTEQRGEQVLNNLYYLFKRTQHHLVEHEWVHHREFEQLVSFMDIGMQVSMSESFNIVTADMVHNNVPVIVSNDVSWVPWLWRCSPTDTNAIIRKLHQIWFIRGTILEKLALQYNRLSLHRYNKKALEAWKIYLRGI